jgi:hypothetical protein
MARKADLPNTKPSANSDDKAVCGPRDDNPDLPVTNVEQALFSVCFGTMIDRILAEPD